jgi:hypothetical protein
VALSSTEIAEALSVLNQFKGRNYVRPDEIGRVTKVPVAALGRAQLPYKELSDAEVAAVTDVFNYGVAVLSRVAPSIAATIRGQLTLALLFAGVAKAYLGMKNFTFPSVPGHLGVNLLFPQVVNYKVDTATAPTSYSPNSWDIPLTAGTRAYILGSDTAWYKTSSIVDKRHCILIFHNGLVEVGTTPSVEQFRLISESKGDYGIYTVNPLVDLQVEPNKAVYQYPTPLGALFIEYQTGVRWYFMPRRTGTATMKLLGLVFYEHDFAPDVRWVT